MHPGSGVAADAGAVAQSGDAAPGLTRLFHDEYPSLVRIAYALTADSNLAEELAQEAFARSWRRLERLRDPAAAPAYLRQTLVNLVRRSARRRLREMRNRVAPPQEAAYDDVADRMAIADAMRRLPPRQRACIALRYLEGRTESDTAEILGVRVGTVKSQTHKALRTMRGLLGEDE